MKKKWGPNILTIVNFRPKEIQKNNPTSTKAFWGKQVERNRPLPTYFTASIIVFDNSRLSDNHSKEQNIISVRPI
jgi:hypothetical protein